MKHRALIVLIFACAASPLAQAQWQYRDATGSIVFSDQPPPPSVKISDIMKGPGIDNTKPAEPVTPAKPTVKPPGSTGKGSSGSRPDYDPAATAAAKAKADAAVAAAAKPGEDPAKAAMDKKQTEEQRKKEQADAAAKRDADEAAAKQKAASCEANKANLRSYESGGRIATTNEKGEKVVMEDAERTRKAAAARDAIAKVCN
jgi:hypothetical protein